MAQKGYIIDATGKKYDATGGPKGPGLSGGNMGPAGGGTGTPKPKPPANPGSIMPLLPGGTKPIPQPKDLIQDKPIKPGDVTNRPPVGSPPPSVTNRPPFANSGDGMGINPPKDLRRPRDIDGDGRMGINPPRPPLSRTSYASRPDVLARIRDFRSRARNFRKRDLTSF